MGKLGYRHPPESLAKISDAMRRRAGVRRGIVRKLDAALAQGPQAVAEWAKSYCVVDDATGCWIWQKTKNGAGYAVVCDPRQPINRPSPPRVVVSRLLCEVLHGLDGHWTKAQTRHSCDTPACVNPDHLLLGTPRDNGADKVSRGRAARPQGMLNGRARVTPAQAIELRQLHSQGWTNAELAARFGVSTTTVSNVHRGNHWTARLKTGA
jgi:hypothetical protein